MRKTLEVRRVRLVLPTTALLREYRVFADHLAHAPFLESVTVRSVFESVVDAARQQNSDMHVAFDLTSRSRLPYEQVIFLVTEPVYLSHEFILSNDEDKNAFAYVLENTVARFYLFLLQWLARMQLTAYQIDNVHFVNWHGYDAVVEFPDL